MLGVGDERGVHACKDMGQEGRVRLRLEQLRGKSWSFSRERGTALFVSWLVVFPLYETETGCSGRNSDMAVSLPQKQA